MWYKEMLILLQGKLRLCVNVVEIFSLQLSHTYGQTIVRLEHFEFLDFPTYCKDGVQISALLGSGVLGDYHKRGHFNP